MKKIGLRAKEVDVMHTYTLSEVCGVGHVTLCRNNSCFALHCSVPVSARGFEGNILFILYKYLLKQTLLLHYSSDKKTKAQRS